MGKGRCRRCMHLQRSGSKLADSARGLASKNVQKTICTKLVLILMRVRYWNTELVLDMVLQVRPQEMRGHDGHSIPRA
eukprot:scaffold32743_cov67-Skeletonema_dohrnii-CCMP3373.AAC.2